MRILPGTTIKLYSGVEIDNDEQLAFSSIARQTAYFESKLKYTATNCTMNKKTGYVRLSCTGAIASQCNYMSFINPNFDNKVIYCRIVDYEYVNNECTEVAYVIDYFQTWMFDVSYDSMYITRENLSQEDWNKLEANPYDQTVLEMRTPETLATGNTVEKIKYTITEGIATSAYDGGSLFYESQSENDTWYDILFVSDIDWNKLDEGDEIYSGVIWDNYVKYTQSTDSPLSYDDWRELHSYGSSKPSDAYIEAVRDGYEGDFWAVYWNSDNTWWIKNDTSYDVKNVNTKMSMPYCIFIFRHSSVVKLIDVLTQAGCVSSIMAMYTLPERLLNNFLDGQGSSVFTDIEIDSSKIREKSSVKSHKLLNFPYSYFTMDDADGNSKEFHYEETYDSDTFKIPIRTTIDLNTQPSLIAVTANGHKEAVGGYAGSMIDNAMVYEAIPQTPYMCDAYLAFVAESAKAIAGNNTTDYGYTIEQQQFSNNFAVLKQGVELGKSILDTAAGGVAFATGGEGTVTSAGGVVSAGLDTYETGMNYAINQNRLQNTEKMMSSVSATLAGDTNTPIASNFAKCRQAYAANIYHAGSRGGILHYLQGPAGEGLNKPDIYYIHHRLNDEIRAQYDLYFQQFGYTSNRCGIPRVCNFMKGSTAAADVPHWETINGKSVTYVQVTNCKVVYSMLPVAKYFQGLFQGGCRFINGDTLV